jgi:tetratricopeptide (TPR) repeat protein
MVHHSLAGLYLRLGRKSDAKRQYEKAIEAEDIPVFKEVRAAVMLLDLYPSNRARLLEARQHAQRAISMQPQSQDARQILAQIDARLNR